MKKIILSLSLLASFLFSGTIAEAQKQKPADIKNAAIEKAMAKKPSPKPVMPTMVYVGLDSITVAPPQPAQKISGDSLTITITINPSAIQAVVKELRPYAQFNHGIYVLCAPCQPDSIKKFKQSDAIATIKQMIKSQTQPSPKTIIIIKK